MALSEEHFKKLLKSTEPAFYGERVKEDIMQRIMNQNKKKKNSHKKIARFCLRTSVFLALTFLGCFVLDIGFNLSPKVQEMRVFRTVMALVFILIMYTLIALYKGLSKDLKVS